MLFLIYMTLRPRTPNQTLSCCQLGLTHPGTSISSWWLSIRPHESVCLPEAVQGKHTTVQARRYPRITHPQHLLTSQPAFRDLDHKLPAYGNPRVPAFTTMFLFTLSLISKNQRYCSWWWWLVSHVDQTHCLVCFSSWGPWVHLPMVWSPWGHHLW